MKPEEAIAIIETEKSCIEKSTKGQCSINCGECKENVPIAYKMKSYDMAIEALKEVQLYHLIKDVTIGEIAEVLKEFSEIGTVEECREAVENKKKCEKQWHNDMENPLEPIKVYSALKSEILKLELRIKNRPKDISILDYTVIAALQKVLKNNLEAMEDE